MFMLGFRCLLSDKSMIAKTWFLTVCFVLTTLFYQCSPKKETEVKSANENSSREATIHKLSIHYALPNDAKVPADNPQTPEKIELGRLLFYDPVLSGNKDVACATCHHPSNGYAEYRDLSIGVNGRGFGSSREFNKPNDIPFVKRNAQTILNSAFNGMDIYNDYDPENAPMFWDVRSKSLESQSLEPLLAMEEMRGKRFTKEEILAEVTTRLKNIPEYVSLFEEAFINEQEPINTENLAKAMAAFERTLITNNSRFDQYLKGDSEAISLSEKEGFKVFNEAGCGNCHNGAMFSDFKPHVLGVPTNPKLSTFDKGIGEEYGFRTASLRNLRFTAPYMHNGQFNTLKEVLEFYEDIAGGKEKHPEVKKDQYDPLINDLRLSVKDMGPILSFLNSLNDEDFDKKVPHRVPSGLPVGGSLK